MFSLTEPCRQKFLFEPLLAKIILPLTFVTAVFLIITMHHNTSVLEERPGLIHIDVGDVQEVVLRDRRLLSEDGIFVVIVSYFVFDYYYYYQPLLL